MESNAFTEVRPSEAEAAKLAEYAKSQIPPTVTPLRTILMPDSIAEAHVLIAMGQAYLESVDYTGPSPTKVSITLPEAQVNYRTKYIELCKAVSMYMEAAGTDYSADGYDFIMAALSVQEQADGS